MIILFIALLLHCYAVAAMEQFNNLSFQSCLLNLINLVSPIFSILFFQSFLNFFLSIFLNLVLNFFNHPNNHSLVCPNFSCVYIFLIYCSKKTHCHSIVIHSHSIVSLFQGQKRHTRH